MLSIFFDCAGTEYLMFYKQRCILESMFLDMRHTSQYGVDIFG
jgi:hypothetical protein